MFPFSLRVLLALCGGSVLRQGFRAYLLVFGIGWVVVLARNQPPSKQRVIAHFRRFVVYSCRCVVVVVVFPIYLKWGLVSN